MCREQNREAGSNEMGKQGAHFKIGGVEEGNKGHEDQLREHERKKKFWGQGEGKV